MLYIQLQQSYSEHMCYATSQAESAYHCVLEVTFRKSNQLFNTLFSITTKFFDETRQINSLILSSSGTQICHVYIFKHTTSGAGNIAVLRVQLEMLLRTNVHREQMQMKHQQPSHRVANGTGLLRGFIQDPQPHCASVSPE